MDVFVIVVVVKSTTKFAGSGLCIFFSGLNYLFCYSPQQHLLGLVCVCSSVDCFCYSPQQTLLGMICVCSCWVVFLLLLMLL